MSFRHLDTLISDTYVFWLMRSGLFDIDENGWVKVVYLRLAEDEWNADDFLTKQFIDPISSKCTITINENYANNCAKNPKITTIQNVRNQLISS